MAFKKVPVTYVIVTLQVEGIHNWPEVEAFVEGVSFLKHPHRHMFHIKATAKVDHDDRAKEIILLKREILQYLYRTYNDTFPVGPGVTYVPVEPVAFGSRSCEMIAKDLCEAFDLRSCEVLEDGENGALVEIQTHFIPSHTTFIPSMNTEDVQVALLDSKIVKERDTFDDSHLKED